MLCIEVGWSSFLFLTYAHEREKEGTNSSKRPVLERKVCCVGCCAKMTRHDRDIRDSLFTHRTTRHSTYCSFLDFRLKHLRKILTIFQHRRLVWASESVVREVDWGSSAPGCLSAIFKEIAHKNPAMLKGGRSLQVPILTRVEP